MKKLISLFVMAIFLISLVPAAFAVNDDAGQEQNQGVTAQAQNQAQATKAMPLRERVKNIKERNIALRERYQKNKELLKERLDKAREIRAEAKAKHQEARQKIQEKKQELAACKENNSTDCVRLRKETKMHTKDYLSNVAEHILAMIAKTKERVENSALDEAEKTEMIAALDEKAEEIAGALDTIEELGEDSTKEEYMEAAKIIKESWKDLRLIIKKGIGRVANGKIHAISVRLGNLQNKLHKIVERLENAGKDTSKVKPLLEEFDEKLQEAKDARDRARALYQEGKTEEAVEATKEAHTALREAHKALKDFVRALKEIKGGEDALEGEDTEDEEAETENAESEETPVEQAEDIGEHPEEGDDEDQEGSEGNETA